jgi:hypothetical protein
VHFVRANAAWVDAPEVDAAETFSAVWEAIVPSSFEKVVFG